MHSERRECLSAAVPIKLDRLHGLQRRHGLLDCRRLWRVEQLGTHPRRWRLIPQSLDREHQTLERDAPDLRCLRRLALDVVRELGDQMEGQPRSAPPSAPLALLDIRTRDDHVVE